MEELETYKATQAYSLVERAYKDIIEDEDLSGALKTALFYSFERAKEDINFRAKLIPTLQLFIEGNGAITHNELGDRLYRIA